MKSALEVSPSQANFLDGGLAGLVATLPMTLVMLVLHRFLPRRQRYALDPQRITRRVSGWLGLGEARRSPAQEILAGAAHFGFGATAGTLFPALAARLPLPRWMAGMLYGMLIWFGSYQGWIPQTRLLPPASDEPARRNLLMIMAHLVWGAVLGWGTARQEG